MKENADREAMIRARKGMGLTQRELAVMAGCSLSTIATTERGRFLPGPELRARIAGVLGSGEEVLFPDAFRERRGLMRRRGDAP